MKLFLLLALALTAAPAFAAKVKISCDCGTDVDFGRGHSRSWVSYGHVTIYADPSNYYGAAQQACLKKSHQLGISYRCNFAD